MWETTVMHKQVSGRTVNFGPKFSRPKVYSGISPPPFRKTSDLGWPKFTPEYPPISENFRFGMTKVYSGIPPHFGKLQIWDDQSLLQNTPPFRKTSDLGWPKFTPEYPPHFGKLQIWDDQSLLRNTPPISENFRFGMTKVYSGIPPLSENFRFGMTKVYSGIPPHFGKLQIWDDQSLLQNTPPPFWKTSDLGWPKFTPEYPLHFGKLQIWDDQSLLQNTPPISENFRFGMTKVYSGIPPLSENFRFGMTKVYSGIPPLPFRKTSDLGWPKFTPEYPPPPEFRNAESYYMWRLYPTGITTRSVNLHKTRERSWWD